MKEIALTKGYVVLVDDEDYEWLMQWKWCEINGYAVRRRRKSELPGSSLIYMHCEIYKRYNGNYGQLEIDHRDNNGSNNQKSNLRLATCKQNKRNQKLSLSNTTGFKGVSRRKTGKKWAAYIRVNGKLLYLGSYIDIEDAARAYNNAALKYFGEFAHLNVLPRKII